MNKTKKEKDPERIRKGKIKRRRSLNQSVSLDQSLDQSLNQSLNLRKQMIRQ